MSASSLAATQPLTYIRIQTVTIDTHSPSPVQPGCALQLGLRVWPIYRAVFKLSAAHRRRLEQRSMQQRQTGPDCLSFAAVAGQQIDAGGVGGQPCLALCARTRRTSRPRERLQERCGEVVAVANAGAQQFGQLFPPCLRGRETRERVGDGSGALGLAATQSVPRQQHARGPTEQPVRLRLQIGYVGARVGRGRHGRGEARVQWVARAGGQATEGQRWAGEG